jgi:hypothetical protein
MIGSGRFGGSSCVQGSGNGKKTVHSFYNYVFTTRLKKSEQYISSLFYHAFLPFMIATKRVKYLTFLSHIAAEYDPKTSTTSIIFFYLGDLCWIFEQLILYILRT